MAECMHVCQGKRTAVMRPRHMIGQRGDANAISQNGRPAAWPPLASYPHHHHPPPSLRSIISLLSQHLFPLPPAFICAATLIDLPYIVSDRPAAMIRPTCFLNWTATRRRVNDNHPSYQEALCRGLK